MRSYSSLAPTSGPRLKSSYVILLRTCTAATSRPPSSKPRRTLTNQLNQSLSSHTNESPDTPGWFTRRPGSSTPSSATPTASTLRPSSASDPYVVQMLDSRADEVDPELTSEPSPSSSSGSRSSPCSTTRSAWAGMSLVRMILMALAIVYLPSMLYGSSVALMYAAMAFTASGISNAIVTPVVAKAMGLREFGKIFALAAAFIYADNAIGAPISGLPRHLRQHQDRHVCRARAACVVRDRMHHCGQTRQGPLHEAETHPVQPASAQPVGGSELCSRGHRSSPVSVGLSLLACFHCRAGEI
jgi:hypothetical protein